MQRVELEIVEFVEPGTFEILQRKIHSTAERESVNRELHMGVPFFFCLGFVVEDMDVAVADLHEVNVSRDDLALEGDLESEILEIRVGGLMVAGNVDDRWAVFKKRSCGKRVLMPSK